MKVSLNWVKEFTDVQLPIEQLVEKIGTQLGAVDEVINLGERYKDALIVKVIRCEKHPDADKLSVCWVDDGNKVSDVERNEQGLVQIVCGAPNVAAGMLAVWLPPNSVVPSTAGKDPFTLEEREIRGVKSNGMLASAKELGIGDSHEGLLVVEEGAKPGDSFAEVYKLNDYIIDIENKMFTHRPDLFGHLGIAREIAGINGHKFTSPEWYLKPDNSVMTNENDDLAEFGIDNQVPQDVPRFMAAAMSGAKVGPSPLWLQSCLARLGLRPINNVVDITNYLMLLTGQPTHAYDFDKLKALSGERARIVVRRGQDGEKLRLLGGKEVVLDKEVVVIATPNKAIGLGGVMGGADTQVDESTKNIILECATFDMNITRKTAMKFGLFTDAVTRFTKGQSPLQNPAVLTYGVKLMSEITGAEVSGAPWDNKAEDLAETAPLSTDAAFINSRLGLALDVSLQSQLLDNVEIGVEHEGDNLSVKPPFWRTDLAIAEDIVEEVGRLYGWDHLPQELPVKSIKPAAVDKSLNFKSKVRQILAAGGANEVLTYSFVHGSLLDKVGQDKEQSFHIKNALSPALQYYRQSLVPSLLDKVHPNVKNGFDKFAIFEIGKAHVKKQLDADKLPNEMNILGLVFTDAGKARAGSGAAYYQARNYLDFLADSLGVGLAYKPFDKELDFAIAKPYEPARSALVSTTGGDTLGIVGEFKSSVIAALKLPVASAGFEIDLDVLAKAEPTLKYHPLNKYPEINQDITLKAPVDIRYIDLAGLLSEELDKASQEKGYIYRLQPLGAFQAADDNDHKKYSWRISLSQPERTLTSDEVNKVFDMLEAAAKSKFNSERV
jgi:phenylalanyl-tRNA synthetase beta chain